MEVISTPKYSVKKKQVLDTKPDDWVYIYYSYLSSFMTDYKNYKHINEYFHIDERFDKNLFLNYQSLESIAQSLGSNSTKENVVTISSPEFTAKYGDWFDSLLRTTDFVDGEDNNVTIMFREMIDENKESALSLIQDLFIQYFKKADVSSLTKVIKLFHDYSYKDLYPYSQTIAVGCKSSKSPSVQIATLNLFAHWCNRESLDLLNSMEEPSNILVKVVYDSVKRTLEKKCSMSEK